MSGHVDLDTRSLTGPDSALLPTDSLAAALVVLAPPRRPRSSIGPHGAYDQLLSTGGSLTLIPRA